MWLWEGELRGLGFSRRAGGYWRCARRFGLRGDEHISAFARSEQVVSGRRPGGGGLLVELSEVHVTFPMGENVHFYYHERTETEWEPGGCTSGAEIRRLGLHPARLRERADQIAGEVIAAIGGVLPPR
jgi:hypothetical protein